MRNVPQDFKNFFPSIYIQYEILFIKENSIFKSTVQTLLIYYTSTNSDGCATIIEMRLRLCKLLKNLNYI